jgi:exodeoxyribonuclease VII large subunit
MLAGADALAARFGAVAVRGELSGFTRAGSGHCYFALKDDQGQAALLRCAMFRRAASMLAFAPADGHRVELRGRLDLYAARGELQFIVESLERVGAGSLYEEFLRLRARLEAQGLFDAQRKRPLPVHPQTLGVITSLGAAALRDVVAALARRAPQVRLIIYPSLVQGAEAPAALVAALEAAAKHGQAQALLLVRGGGSLEDLWAFNDERVVRAIALCPLPVVCGVGHESDVTLADLVADVRAPTPTAAAELAAAPQAELLAALQAQNQALSRAVQRRLAALAQGLDHQALRLGTPAAVWRQQSQRVDGLAHRLRHALQPALAACTKAQDHHALRLRRALAAQLLQRRQSLALGTARLQALNPQQVLQRGYAWVEDAQGRAVVSSRALQAGQTVRAVWADGAAQAQVLRVDGAPGGPSVPGTPAGPAPVRKPTRAAPKPAAPGQSALPLD